VATRAALRAKGKRGQALLVAEMPNEALESDAAKKRGAPQLGLLTV